MSVREEVDLAIIKSLTRSLSELCVACLDERGEPRAPSRQALIAARRALPAQWPGTLIKERKL